MNKTLKRRVLALASVASIITTTTGCNKTSILDNTLLEGAFLADIDGYKRVVVQSTLGYSHEHNHYRDILSGSTFAHEEYKESCDRVNFYYKNNTMIADIYNYMTEKEMTAAKIGELTDDMIAEIVYRAIDSEREQEEIENDKTLELKSE